MRKQNTTKSSNIMILVLFIMFIVAVFGLLVSQYITNLISISWLFQQYYKGYYYAYGGLELGLTLVKNHGFGYEESISYSSFRHCARANCSFDLIIKSRNKTLINYTTEPANCTTDPVEGVEFDKTYFQVPAWDALIIPLFRDQTTWFSYNANDSNSFSIIQYNSTSWSNNDMIDDFQPTIYNLWSSTGSYIIRVIDEDTQNYNVTLERQASQTGYAIAAPLSGYEGSVDNKNYLIIANATGATLDFCVQFNPTNPELNSGLYMKYIIIDSVATYGDTNASLRAAKSNPLPSFLWYGTIN